VAEVLAFRRLVATAVLTGGALLAGLGTAPAALAHAKVKSTSPPAGGMVQGTLRQVTITFNEEVTLVPHALRVTTDMGIPIQLEDPRLSHGGTLLAANVQDHLAPGGYAVAWRVMADDGHLESDSFTFTLAGGGPGGDTGTGARPTLESATGSPAPPPSPEEPLWPVFVAIGIAIVGGSGAGLAVRRGLRVAAAESVAVPDHAASREAHASSRLPM